MAEHRFCKPAVVGSTPTLGSTSILRRVGRRRLRHLPLERRAALGDTWLMHRSTPRRALTLVGLVLLLAACARPGTSGGAGDSAEPSPSPELVTFISDRYGYSISHPAGWEMLERPGEFSLTAVRPRHPGTDTLGTPQSHEFDILDGIVIIGARALVDGETLDAFTDEASFATRCGPHGRGTATLAGEPAELRKFECGGTRWHQLTAVHNGLGYMVWVTRPLTTDFLDTFAFTD